MTIVTATSGDFETIRNIAYKTWPETYGKILGSEQLAYMLSRIYTTAALQQTITEKKHQYLLVKENDEYFGFASYQHGYLDLNVTRLHKLYLLPEAQGRGAGKLLIDEIETMARINHSEKVSLNVNRFNKALSFYQKSGYTIVGEENIDIGNGYFMEDYKMEKIL